MKSSSVLIIFSATLIIDLIVLPIVIESVIVPVITLAVLPYFSLFATHKTVIAIYGVFGLIIWLLTGVNLGLVVFSLGTMFALGRWGLSSLFHKNSWQILVASSASIAVFGGLIAGLVFFLTPSEPFSYGQFLIIIAFTAATALIFNIVVYAISSNRYA
jgi:hypothetical protein